MHEKKYCPQCANEFECKAGTIAQCQCYAVKLTVEERMYIEEKFADCLCGDCLEELKNVSSVFKEKFIFG
jgi:hypothetical protein